MSAPARAVESHHHSHGPANRRRRVLETAAPLFVRFPTTLADSGVVVLHDVYGLTESVEQCCRALARLGHLAVAPIFYYQCGGRAYTSDRLLAARSAWSRLTHEDLAADIAGALDYLQRRCGIPASQIALAGIGSSVRLAETAAAEHGVAVVCVDALAE
jgi:dienelactone hydrolase